MVLGMVPAWTLAQSGALRGTVIEDANGEPMIAVNVVIKGTTKGTTTDFDGKFEISADPGVYEVKFSFVSFQSKTIEGVEIKAGEVTSLGTVRLSEDAETLEEVVVSAEQVRNSEVALMTVKRQSPNLIDGLSAERFKQIGDGNAASAMKRVTGVSVQGGKYVYVRGLGDRYTKTTLNGVDVPGLDPDRNALQMDIFPTNVISNIVVSKTFTADQPADFTGGLVNIETKAFPEEKIASFSAGIGYNPDMHLNSDYLSYEGGGTDFLGFDDGTRDIPTDRSTDIPQFADALGNANGPEGQRYRAILGDFNETLAADQQTSPIDFSLGFSMANQISESNPDDSSGLAQSILGLFGGDNQKLGYNLALTYKNDTRFYQEVENNFYGKPDEANQLELEPRELQKGSYGERNVLVGGLAGLALKSTNSKYKLNLMHLQNGTSKAGFYKYEGQDQGSVFEADQHNLEYSERRLTNLLLSGTHFNDDATWRVDWKASPTLSGIDEPDIRFTRIRTDGDGFSVGTESGVPERIWRYLEEVNVVGKVDVTREYKLLEENARLKFGLSQVYKQRDYEIQDFFTPTNQTDIEGPDPSQILDDANLWGPNNLNGTTYNPKFIPQNSNKFDATIRTTGVYVSNEFQPIANLNVIVGLRGENYSQDYTGINPITDEEFEDERVLETFDLFPSLSTKYALNERQNLRFSYARTTARPSFKEASFATILDPISSRTFIGAFSPDVSDGDTIWDGDIQPTFINNFDLRWERFQEGGRMVSVSLFYKTFDNPIEIVQYVSAPNNLQPRNVGNGEVAGVELEVRQTLDFIATTLDKWSFNANLTLTESEIDIQETEFRSRVNSAREGQEVDRQRSMAGQAPYIVNAGFSYADPDAGLEAGFYYNVQGRTLRIVGVADRPDVYSVPFHSLNFNANYAFGLDDRMSLGLKASNILDDAKEKVFEAFEADDQIFSRLLPRRTFSLSFGYDF